MLSNLYSFLVLNLDLHWLHVLYLVKMLEFESTNLSGLERTNLDSGFPSSELLIASNGLTVKNMLHVSDF